MRKVSTAQVVINVRKGVVRAALLRRNEIKIRTKNGQGSMKPIGTDRQRINADRLTLGKMSFHLVMLHDVLTSRTTVIALTIAAHHHRSEEHTSELQSRQYLVCRLLLE